LLVFWLLYHLLVIFILSFRTLAKIRIILNFLITGSLHNHFHVKRLDYNLKSKKKIFFRCICWNRFLDGFVGKSEKKKQKTNKKHKQTNKNLFWLYKPLCSEFVYIKYLQSDQPLLGFIFTPRLRTVDTPLLLAF